MSSGQPLAPMSAEDAQQAGAWLLGMIAAAQHAQDDDEGMSYARPALEALMDRVTHEGAHWLSNVLAAACQQLATRIAVAHEGPPPSPMLALIFREAIERGTAL